MKIRALLAAVPLLFAAAAGCTSAPAASTSATTGTLSVSASFYPFQFIAERVGGDQVSVTNLTAPGSEPHDLELSPQQVAGIADADLVIYQKGFQSAVDDALQTVTPKATVDTASFLTLETEEEEHDDHADEADGHDHGDEGDGHDHGGLDPHTWLNPANMVAITEHVRDALSQQRPEASGQFAANATALIGELNTLDGEFKSGLATCKRKVFITSHEAFGYLAQRYGLEQVGIRGLEPDTEPSAARIAEVQKIAKQYGVTTIFFETLVSPDVSNSVANDLGLTTAVLDPLEGITNESAGTNYLEVMRSNLSALKKANECS